MKWVKFNSRGKNILFLSSLSSKCVSAQRFVLGNGNEYVLRQVLVFTVLHHNNYSLCFVFPNFRYYKGFFSTFLQHIYTCTCTYNATRILRWHWNVSKTTKKFNFLKRWSQHQNETQNYLHNNWKFRKFNRIKNRLSVAKSSSWDNSVGFGFS